MNQLIGYSHACHTMQAQIVNRLLPCIEKLKLLSEFTIYNEWLSSMAMATCERIHSRVIVLAHINRNTHKANDTSVQVLFVFIVPFLRST